MATTTDTSAGDAAEPQGLVYTLEELAAVSGVPARTIRYYQAEKLLQKPHRDRRDARFARYGEEHLERLRLVGELRDRVL
jgi:DNA-binding transcriptional MerR regulator